jgi:hypothetical protein
MDSSPLSSLPTELIFRILDFLKPHEYSGFSCTCQEAVAVVNRKLDNPKDKDGLYLGWDYLDDSKALHTQLPPYKSRTARYVDKERRRRQWESEKRRRELEDYVCVYYGPPSDDEQYL